MRFMMIVKSSSEELAAMGRYNEDLIKAGVLLVAEGLHHSARGARVRFEKEGGHTVIDGPFSESKELVAGFWLIEVKSKQEAIEWAKRIPFGADAEVELRLVAEVEDFAADEVGAEHLAKEQAFREATRKPVGR